MNDKFPVPKLSNKHIKTSDIYKLVTANKEI